MKRRVYRLKWNRKDGVWCLVAPSGGKFQLSVRKDTAEIQARYLVSIDPPSQLLIYTKAGRIGKGGRYEASYGADSKRRKG